jgi:hypothetical protein
MNDQLLGYAVQVVFAALMSFVLQAFKNAKWFPFLNSWSAKWWKVAVSAIVAAASAAGISASFDPTLGQLIVTGLTWSGVGHALLAFAVSFITQHMAYEHVVRGVLPTKLLALLLAVTLAFSATGCGPKTKPALVKFDAGALTAVQTIASVEKELALQGRLTPAESLTIRLTLRPAIDLGEKATAALLVWQPGQATPTSMLELARALGDVLAGATSALKDGEAKTRITLAIAVAQQAWAAAIVLMNQGQPPPPDLMSALIGGV